MQNLSPAALVQARQSPQRGTHPLSGVGSCMDHGSARGFQDVKIREKRCPHCPRVLMRRGSQHSCKEIWDQPVESRDVSARRPVPRSGAGGPGSRGLRRRGARREKIRPGVEVVRSSFLCPGTVLRQGSARSVRLEAQAPGVHQHAPGNRSQKPDRHRGAPVWMRLWGSS